jgi:C1A family cysteine protease
VRDQSTLGSCVGEGTNALDEYLETKNPAVSLSPMFVYKEGLMLEHTFGQDNGLMIRDGLKVLNKIGDCPEVDEPYDISKFANMPSAKAVADATAFKIASYHRVYKVIGMQQALANGCPVVIGVQVYSSFEDDHVAATGLVPVPKRGEEFLGGHCMLNVGYRIDKGFPGGGIFFVKNSWGTGWGDHGYCYIPFAYFTARRASDMWVGKL